MRKSFGEIFTDRNTIEYIIANDQLAIDNQGVVGYPRTHGEYVAAFDTLGQSIISSQSGGFAIQTIQKYTGFMIESIASAFGIPEATLRDMKRHTGNEVFFTKK